MSNNWTPYKDMPDLRGKVAVVTGASSGIGFQTVKHLISRGAKVYFTARTEAKAKATQAQLLQANPNMPLEQAPFLLVDFEEIETATDAAKMLRTQEEKVDILVNNAGGAPSGLEYSPPGWEKSMTSSHIGHFVLTNGLMPLLKKAALSPGADVRIVVVSSNATYFCIPANYRLDFANPDVLYGKLPYKPLRYTISRALMFNVNMLHYAVSKIANAMFATELQTRLKNEGLPIAVMSVHPGGVRSEGATRVFKSWVWPFISGQFVSPDVGSFNTLFAATSKDVHEKAHVYKGQYLEPVGVVHPRHPLMHDEGQTRALWESTQSEVEKYLAKSQRKLLDW